MQRRKQTGKHEAKEGSRGGEGGGARPRERVEENNVKKTKAEENKHFFPRPSFFPRRHRPRLPRDTARARPR